LHQCVSKIFNKASEEIYNISREAVYLGSFNSKHIVKYINSYPLNNYFYTVMEWASGGELTKHVKDKGCLGESSAKIIAKQIQEGIKYIHSKNVIHRDLNPNNILFSDESKKRIQV
jgi:serine/threonine protein kinase